MNSMKEYYKVSLFENLKIIIASLVLGDIVTGLFGLWAYDTWNGTLFEYIIVLVLLAMIVSFIICSIINIFATNIGIVDTIMENIRSAGNHIIGGIFDGAFSMFFAESNMLASLIFFAIGMIRVIVGLLAIAIFIASYVIAAVMVNVIFWIQTLYFLVRYIICRVHEKNAGV